MVDRQGAAVGRCILATCSAASLVRDDEGLVQLGLNAEPVSN